jgi:hypothetical protein
MSVTSWLLSSLPFEEWHFAIWSGSCLDLKGEDYEHGTLTLLDGVYV